MSEKEDGYYSVRAAIVTIGDEILIGQIVDTNSAWIAKELNLIGVKVTDIYSISDDKKAIMSTIETAISTHDIVVLTGGLGPTKDDITKITLSEYFNTPLVKNMAVYNFLEKMLKERGIDFNTLNEGQSYVPQSCVVLHNDVGTAPGMMFEREDKLLFSLPGVPFEMKYLMEQHVIKQIKNHFSLKTTIHRTVITYGLPESELATVISSWEDSLPKYIRLAYLPNPKGVRLRLSSYQVEDYDKIENEITNIFDDLKNIIPLYFIGYEDAQASVEKSVADMLSSNSFTMSVAESCTGGNIAGRFTAMPGASSYFMGGVVAYSDDVKHNVLGVSIDMLKQYGAVSAQVAEQMAEGVKRVMKTDYSVSTTGIAGPTGGSDLKPVGMVWFAVSTPYGTYSEVKNFGTLREQNIARASSFAIDMLRKYMLKDENKV